eukprot:TRINITY_DN2990_c0_g1_i1.p1 TRINITY_DN2990_c0_g1~~TRINITY_DN2990_c0_g1_i1.p1  ORF type:complete len:177 (-),score=27.48 TRINITY_DN2990_c0_g1_i1:141-632(-)
MTRTVVVLLTILGLASAGFIPRGRGGCGPNDFLPVGRPVVQTEPEMTCFNMTQAPEDRVTGLYVSIADIAATYEPTYYVENWCMLVAIFDGPYTVHCRVQPGDVVWAGQEDESKVPGEVLIDWAPQTCVPDDAKQNPRCEQTQSALRSFRANFTINWAKNVVH